MSEKPVELAVQVDAARLPASADELGSLLQRMHAAAGFEGRLSVAVIDDPTMQVVNRDYHQCDEPTDVLAFPLGEAMAGGPTGGFAAEVVISLDTAEREAAARGVDVTAELMLYATHGVLHLLGYDDHDPQDARTMHLRTLEILSALGMQNRIEGLE